MTAHWAIKWRETQITVTPWLEHTLDFCQQLCRLWHMLDQAGAKDNVNALRLQRQRQRTASHSHTIPGQRDGVRHQVEANDPRPTAGHFFAVSADATA